METDFNPVSMSPSIGALAAALAKAQSEMRNPAFDRVNPHFKNRYATLSAHLDAVRGPLSKNGIAIMQCVSTPDPSWVTVTTILSHSSGEWISSDAGGKSGQNIQQTGSTITYLRRYTLSAILGIVGDEDDDGEADRSNDRTAAPAKRERNTFSTAEARGLMKALAAKKLSYMDLREAMTKAGLDPAEEITDWPTDWKPRIKSWLDTQPVKSDSDTE